VVPQPSGASLGYLQDLGKSDFIFNPNYHIPAFWSWSLAYEIAVSKRDIVSVSYVGNRVPNNPENNNINQISPQWNAQCDVERGGNRQLCDRCRPGRQPISGQIAAFAGSGYYNSNTLSKFQLNPSVSRVRRHYRERSHQRRKELVQRFPGGWVASVSGSLSLHATYTHAKAESVGGWVPGANTIWAPTSGTNNPTTGWVDQLNHVMAREVSTFADVKHSVNLSGVAILPFGRNRLLLSNANRFVDEIVNGWEIAPLYTYYSGFAWRPQDSGGGAQTIYDHAGNWEIAQRWACQ
jgi:hypothetical protein